ncbi:MAG: hypothetical protein EAX96_16405 [Candidatus Lokiarchaeota archaeon]|nr:hypothetical protein [Candidatus Lokiarchaeota archaeon]
MSVMGGIMEYTFLEYISQKEYGINDFETEALKLYNSWQSTGGRLTTGISDFFKQKGSDLFKKWLSEVFPFNEENLSIDVNTHSEVDTQYNIIYVFQPKEIQAVKDILAIQKLESQIKDVLISLFINSVKIISRVFKTLIGEPYKIFTSSLDVDFIDEKSNCTIDFKGAGRVQE